MCGIEVVKTDRIFGALNFSSNAAIKTNPKKYIWNYTSKDTYSSQYPKLNPALQNPIYRINDSYLAKISPAMFIQKYSNAQILNSVAQTNPNIRDIIGTGYNSVKIYPQNSSSAINPHFIPTEEAAIKIMQKCGEKFSPQDYNSVRQAALLHDVGKAYIPYEILNKKGKLTPQEKEIVDKHARLSYEVLKTAGVDGAVLNLVRNHHTYSKNNPPTVQILQIADIWSALKEKRSYKEAYSNDKALGILYERAQNGDFDKKYIYALAA